MSCCYGITNKKGNKWTQDPYEVHLKVHGDLLVLPTVICYIYHYLKLMLTHKEKNSEEERLEDLE